MLAGYELRRRPARLMFLTLLVGVVGAVVLSTSAGARRSQTSLTRFNESSRSSNLEIYVGSATSAQIRAFGRLPEVASYARLRGGAMQFDDVEAVACAVDSAFGRTVDAPRLVKGRLAAPTAADEVDIGESLAQKAGLTVGDHLDGTSFTPEQVAGFLSGSPTVSQTPDGPRIHLRIVGIVRRPLDLGDRGDAGGVLVMTPAANRKYEATTGTFNGTILRVRTRRGAADIPAVTAAARRMFGKSPLFGTKDLAIESQGAQSAIDAMVAALWVFSGVAMLAGLVGVTIVLSREISLIGLDQTTHRTLGLTRWQGVALGVSQVLPVAAGGALLASVGAAVASPLFPLGVARRAEPNPGLRLDWAVLGFGTLAVLGAVVVVGFIAAVASTDRHRADGPAVGRAARVVAATSGAGVPPVATIGARMALEPGRGSTAVPVRSAISGAVIGVLGVIAVLVFLASLDRLVATPARYGWNWDFAAVPDSPAVVSPHSQLRRDPGVSALSEVSSLDVQVDGHPVTAWAYRSLRGSIIPVVVAGRAPRQRDEIALGAGTLAELHKTIGDTVQGDGPGGRHDYRVVGRAVFPRFDSPQPLANGADLTSAGLDQLVGQDDQNLSFYLAARVTPVGRTTVVERRIDKIPNVEAPFGPSVPFEAARLRQVRALPAALAAMLGILGLVSVAHALVTSVRRRRRDLAILRTLGFDRGQIRAAIVWQATTLAAAGLLIGIPSGLALGSLVWRHIADGLGVSPSADVPVLAVALTAIGTLLLVSLIAFTAAATGSRTAPAVALRSE